MIGDGFKMKKKLSGMIPLNYLDKKKLETGMKLLKKLVKIWK